MKKIFLALIFIFLFSSVACADLPSITMLSTKDCPACAQMSKVLKELKANYSNKISTVHIYLENNPDIAKKYKIRFVRH